MTIVSFCQFFFRDEGTLEKGLETDNLLGGLTEEEKERLPKCPSCNLPVPPRCYHCYKCDVCHLKACTHISIFGKCVAIKNQRPFIVFLKWIAVANIIDAIIILIMTFNGSLAILVGIVFSISYLSIGIVFEILWDDEMDRVRANLTQIEKKKHVSSRLYDAGKRKNVEEVFGTGFFRYYIPSRSNLIGFEWMEL